MFSERSLFSSAPTARGTDSAPPNPRAAEPLVMCAECGCTSLVFRGHKVARDPRGQLFRFPVAALTCDDCGRCYVADETWVERADTSGLDISERPTWTPRARRLAESPFVSRGREVSR